MWDKFKGNTSVKAQESNKYLPKKNLCQWKKKKVSQFYNLLVENHKDNEIKGG